MRILVADDEKDLRAVVVPVIERLGHQVVEAADGVEALHALDASQVQHEPIRVIVCDWVMPELDGLSVVKKIRSSNGRDYVYFIMLTGRDCTREEYREAMASGVDDFLRKPLDQEELSTRLKVAERILTLTQRIEKLEGLLPICMYCKRIRKTDQSYQAVELYVMERSAAKFTHGICPECAKTHLPPPSAK